MEDKFEEILIGEYNPNYDYKIDKEYLEDSQSAKKAIITEKILIYKWRNYILYQRFEDKKTYIFKAFNNSSNINDILLFEKKNNYNFIKIIVSFSNIKENGNGEEEMKEGGLKSFEISNNKVKGKLIIQHSHSEPYDLIKINKVKILYYDCCILTIFNIKTKQIESIINLNNGFSDLSFKYFFSNDIANFYDDEFFDNFKDDNKTILNVDNFEFINKICMKNKYKNKYIYHIDDTEIKSKHEMNIYIYDSEKKENNEIKVVLKNFNSFWDHSFCVMCFCKYLINNTIYFVFSLDITNNLTDFYLGKINIKEKPCILKHCYLDDCLNDYVTDDLKYMNNKIFYIKYSNKLTRKIIEINDDDSNFSDRRIIF